MTITATRDQPLIDLDLGTVVRVPRGDDGSQDLVVAEVRRSAAGWEVYGRPLNRPDRGHRVRAVLPGPEIRVVADEDDLRSIRTALADHLAGPKSLPAAGDAPLVGTAVSVAEVSEDSLGLDLEIAGTLWRVVL